MISTALRSSTFNLSARASRSLRLRLKYLRSFGPSKMYADAFRSPYPLVVPNHMKPVDDDLGRREESAGDVSVGLVHIRDEMREVLPVGERFQIILNGRRRAIGQDIQNLALLGRGKDGLKPFGVNPGFCVKPKSRGKMQFLVACRMRREAGLCLPALTAR